MPLWQQLSGGERVELATTLTHSLDHVLWGGKVLICEVQGVGTEKPEHSLGKYKDLLNY